MGNLLEDVLHAVSEAKEPTQVTIQRTAPLSPDALFRLCSYWKTLRIEQTAEGDLIVMTPAAGESGLRNADVTYQLRAWAKRDGTGRSFDSSTGFVLPSGAERSPDASWVLSSRLAKLTPEQWQKFLPLCPDFVVEIMSPSDRLVAAQSKMEEYLRAGARLGILIAPKTRRVYLYRPDQPMQELEKPMTVSGEPELAGFALDMSDIWEPF